MIREEILNAIESALDPEELIDILELSTGDLINGRLEDILEEDLDKVLEYIGYEQPDE